MKYFECGSYFSNDASAVQLFEVDVSPLLTIVIPTFGRPEFLERSVRSALDSAPGGEVEVIVVPNGPDESWKLVLDNISRSEVRLKVHPIEASHANVARNHGLSLANGKYVRFLDDDDYLFPDVARQQIEFIEAHQAEVCSARVRSVDSEMNNLGTGRFSDSKDFVCAVLDISTFRLPTGNVFLRSALVGASWDELVPRQQDHVWMIHLAGMREWHWIDFPQEVGVWVHHAGPRISSSSVTQPYPSWLERALDTLHESLVSEMRVSDARALAVACAYWRLSHNYFRRRPLYCHRLAQKALLINPDSRPPLPVIIHPDFDSKVPWLLVEWLLLPLSYAVYCCRLVLEKLYGPEKVRRL